MEASFSKVAAALSAKPTKRIKLQPSLDLATGFQGCVQRLLIEGSLFLTCFHEHYAVNNHTNLTSKN